MLGGAVGAGSPGGDGDLLTVTVVKDEHGYGMKVSGDNPVYVQSVKEHGAAWRAGLRSGDRILRVDAIPVHHHTHQQVVHMIRTNPSTVLTVQQNSSRQKTPITAPVPVNPEKQRQLEVSKVHTVRLMLEKEQKYIRDLRNELLKVPDVRKQAQLESAEQRCAILQHEIDTIMAGQPTETQAPSTPRLSGRVKSNLDKLATGSPPPNTGFLSGLPRSLSNLTGQSLRNLRQARQNKLQQENQPPLVRQNSDDTNNKRRHNNTVPIVPTTCLDNTPPPLPPRSIERPKRNPLSPTISPTPINPLAKPKPSISPLHKQYYKGKPYPMHQSMPNYREDPKLRRSSHSLDGELDGPQPNSIALQMSYPLVNAPPPPLQTDNRTGIPVLHVRSRSSPEHLDHDLVRGTPGVGGVLTAGAGDRGTPPPGTPPPPYAHNTQPCADPQRAIISMEEDDSPASDNSTYSGLFSNLRSVRESKARTAVLLNWLLGERRCACASLLLVLTDAYRSAAGVTTATLRRWAYEIQSTFLMPNAVLQLNGVDEHMANEIDHVLVNEYDKEELLRNVFRKARLQAKEELARQLSEFQVKRQVGLGSLYGPDDAMLSRCDVDRTQEQVVVERLMCQQLSAVASAHGGCGGAPSPEAHAALLAALAAAALCLHCRPASVAAAVGGSRASFLQRDKLYKQRVKQITKQHPQPFVVRGHHLQVQALTSVAHCHHCELVIAGLAPQAYYCTDCKLRVHRGCAKYVEESCCMDGEQHHNNRISRFMERIHHPPSGLDSSDKKSRKSSGTAHFLNMERSLRKMEDEQPWDQTLTPASALAESRREGSTDEPSAPDLDLDTSDNTSKELPEKEHSWRGAVSARGVNRAESCRERDAPRRGKHRNASDPNRLTAHHNHDLEPGAATAPSGSSSSSSLSSKSNESNTVAAEQPSQTDWSEEEEPLAAQWADSLPPHVLDSLLLSPRIRKRQEVIHELIVSEGSHVRWLKVLGKVFLHDLEGQSSLLPPDELKALFPNLPGVRERHARLYADLRAARIEAANHIVQIRPIADAMLNTLGETGYAACLSRFCRGQRMALDCLRERRRKNKELQQFLSAREQLPLCGRLQLKDLLACVWQRLTKYQLLLEGILKTVNEDCGDPEEGEGESPEDVAQLRRALATAKEVLHSVDTAIRTAENEHRLRTIQNKMELRIPGGSGGSGAAGGEWEELRRLELTQHSLRMEGELAVRGDANKRTVLLALMLEEALVLLHREGDKFILRPIGSQLSPIIKWDKVLFRPNAAVRNTFFLMNINGVQMHELSANTAAEYATWVKHIQEAPLARLTELKPSFTPSHQQTRSTDDSGINVSRNPSDASTKSSSSAPHYESPERNTPVERDTPIERDADTIPPEKEKEEVERDRDIEKERESEREKDVDSDLDSRQRRATVGRISTHGSDVPPALEPLHAITVREPASQCVHTAHRAYSRQERLRRLDETIGHALRAKSGVVAELLGVPPDSYAQVAELAVAETLGHLGHDVSGERLRTDTDAAPDIHQLLLAAQAQVSQLTAVLSGALSVSEAAVVAARAGRCGSCSRPRRDNSDTPDPPIESHPVVPDVGKPHVPHGREWGAEASLDMLESYDTLADISGHCDTAVEPPFDTEWSGSAARLAGRLVDVAGGLQAALGQLATAVPAMMAERAALRAELAVMRERLDCARTTTHATDYQMMDDHSLPKSNVDYPMQQDQQSNGG